MNIYKISKFYGKEPFRVVSLQNLPPKDFLRRYKQIKHFDQSGYASFPNSIRVSNNPHNIAKIKAELEMMILLVK